MKSRQILKFLRLPSIERWVLVKAAIFLVLVRLGLFLFSFKTLLNQIECVKSKRVWTSNNGGIASDRIAWAVVVASRYIPFTKCLAQAIVTQILFARYGYTAQLHIGVAKDGRERLKAHAWVESQGRIVIGDLKDISRYSQLPSLKRENSKAIYLKGRGEKLKARNVLRY